MTILPQCVLGFDSPWTDCAQGHQEAGQGEKKGEGKGGGFGDYRIQEEEEEGKEKGEEGGGSGREGGGSGREGGGSGEEGGGRGEEEKERDGNETSQARVQIPIEAKTSHSPICQ